MDNHERGGNEVRVVLKGTRENLRAVWDSDVVRGLGDDPATLVAALELQITAEETAVVKGLGSELDEPVVRNREDHTLFSTPGHGGTEAPIILPSDFAQREAHIARTQLERAGVQLAMLLKAISGK